MREEIGNALKVLPHRIYRSCLGDYVFVLCLVKPRGGHEEHVVYMGVDAASETRTMPLREFIEKVPTDHTKNVTKQGRYFELADLGGNMLDTIPTDSLVMELGCRGDRPSVLADLPEKLTGLKMHDDYVLGHYLSEGEVNEDIFAVGPFYATLNEALHEQKYINNKSGQTLKIFRRVYIPVEG